MPIFGQSLKFWRQRLNQSIQNQRFINGPQAAYIIGAMLKIEKRSQDGITLIRLVGRVRQENLAELSAQMKSNGPKVVLDLEEVTLVDADVVQFLGAAERDGTELANCPLFLREWIRLDNAGKMPDAEI
jgi:hypothetical protein